MTITLAQGAVLTLLRSTDRSATGLIPQGVITDIDNVGGRITAEGDQQVTGNGTSRVMIRVDGLIPVFNEPGSANEGKVIEKVSAHVVLTVPKKVRENIVYEYALRNTSEAADFVQILLNALSATLVNGKQTASPELNVQPAIRGIVGQLPLDVDTGSYAIVA